MIKIAISKKTGAVRGIYSDNLIALARRMGVPTITRASHVEPTADGRWDADMSPSGGPPSLAQWLGVAPWDTRAAALGAEAGWLDANVISPTNP